VLAGNGIALGVTVMVALAPGVPLAARLPEAGAKLNGLGEWPRAAVQLNG
jgi:hypothetical protein